MAQGSAWFSEAYMLVARSVLVLLFHGFAPAALLAAVCLGIIGVPLVMLIVLAGGFV